ncbi:hypothetical protein [uncultured Pseudoteredinibacter sp.]|uniref:hypothetical protein n=1 Tax=uncultured Pseudoteredinibacter sp. TaxID=1641701 RepID=UPI002615C353|nr:hypothetical protein [uncultured Pseudoteredinibacter sp.]
MNYRYLLIVLLGSCKLLSSSSAVASEEYYGLSLQWKMDSDISLLPDTLKLEAAKYEYRDIESTQQFAETRQINGELTSNTDAIIISETDISELGLGGGLIPGDEVLFSFYAAGASEESTKTTTSHFSSDRFNSYGLAFYIPLNKHWKQPTFAIFGGYGEVDLYGKLGLSYDFHQQSFGVPVSLVAKEHIEVEIQDLKNWQDRLFIGFGHNNKLKALDTTTVETSKSMRALCDDSTHNFYMLQGVNNNSKSFSFCYPQQ